MKYIFLVCLLIILLTKFTYAIDLNFVCKDETNFTTVFKINRSQNKIILVASMIDEKSSTFNAGEKYYLNEILEVVDWKDQFAIAIGKSLVTGVPYSRFFNFEVNTITITVYNEDKEPWVKKSSCIIYE